MQVQTERLENTDQSRQSSSLY